MTHNAEIDALVREIQAMRPSTAVSRLSIPAEREDEVGRLAYRRAVNDVLERIYAWIRGIGVERCKELHSDRWAVNRSNAPCLGCLEAALATSVTPPAVTEACD